MLKVISLTFSWLVCIAIVVSFALSVTQEEPATPMAKAPRVHLLQRRAISQENEYPLTEIRVVDGDTVEANIEFPLGVTLRKEMIRFLDFDAWEATKRRRSVNVTDEEVIKGKEATSLLISLIDGNHIVLLLADSKRDMYGRVLGRMVVYTNDDRRIFVAEYMYDNGMWRIEDDEEN